MNFVTKLYKECLPESTSPSTSPNPVQSQLNCRLAASVVNQVQNCPHTLRYRTVDFITTTPTTTSLTSEKNAFLDSTTATAPDVPTYQIYMLYAINVCIVVAYYRL